MNPLKLILNITDWDCLKQKSDSEPRPIQVALLNKANDAEFQAGLINHADYVCYGGVQLGVLCSAEDSSGLQIGGICATKDKAETQIGLICYAGDSHYQGDCKQFGIITLRGNGPWHSRFSPLFGLPKADWEWERDNKKNLKLNEVIFDSKPNSGLSQIMQTYLAANR